MKKQSKFDREKSFGSPGADGYDMFLDLVNPLELFFSLVE